MPIQKTSAGCFDDEARVQDKQQVQDQQSYKCVFVVSLTFPRSASTDMTTAFHAGPYGRFIGTKQPQEKQTS